MATARYRPDAFPKGPRTRKTPVRGNISPPCIQIQLILARYACYVSKNPAKRRWGIHRANILPPRGVFAVRNPQIMHGAQILPPSDGLGPCAGVPTPQRLANTRHLPMPATRCTHYSQRQAADELRWRSFGAWPTVWPSPEGPPTASSRRAGRQRNAAQNWA